MLYRFLNFAWVWLLEQVVSGRTCRVRLYRQAVMCKHYRIPVWRAIPPLLIIEVFHLKAQGDERRSAKHFLCATGLLWAGVNFTIRFTTCICIKLSSLYFLKRYMSLYSWVTPSALCVRSANTIVFEFNSLLASSGLLFSAPFVTRFCF